MTQHPRIPQIVLVLVSLLATLAPAQQSIEKRLAALESEVAEIKTVVKVPAATQPAAVALGTLQGVKFEAGVTYRLTPGYYAVVGSANGCPITLPARTVLDATGSTIAASLPGQWASVAQLAGDGATLRGGTWLLTNQARTSPSSKDDLKTFRNTQRVATVVSAASGCVIEDVTLGVPDAWGLIEVNGTRGLTIRRCRAESVYSYLVYAYGAADLAIDGCEVTRGSIAETPLRFHDFANLTVRGCAIANTYPKGGAIRVHNGRGALIEKNAFRGIVTTGPLGDGDGGDQIGVSQWYARDARGNLVRNDDKAKADVAGTLAKRAEVLGQRASGIVWRDNDITGYFGVYAGVEDAIRVEGGSLRSDPSLVGAANTLAQPFNRIKLTYPTTTLLGDVMRPRSIVELKGVALGGAVSDIRAYLPAGWTLVSCTYNGSAL